jgi:thymidine phosphorylase
MSAPQAQSLAEPVLKVRRLGLETQHEPIVLMHAECPVARSEGFGARAEIELVAEGRSAIATLYLVRDGIVGPHEIGMSDAVSVRLGVPDGTPAIIRHPQPVASMSAVRAKLYGHRLEPARIHEIIRDIVRERYSDVELAAFVSAFSSQAPDFGEMVALTRAMVDVGDRLSWPSAMVLDKHSVGGLPANRTTPLIVAIVAAAGLVIPKTSSRAITSPAGTADAMETMAPVDLDVAAMRRVVEEEGGCIVWGGSVSLSPADDILIRVARALDIDSPAQLVASVLSKKIAAGSTHVLLDMPVGPTAKVRTDLDAAELSAHLQSVGRELGIVAMPVQTDGRQPVGRGIGPALEARDVLSVLRGDAAAPADLKERSLFLSGKLLELAGRAPAGRGQAEAAAILGDGRALGKFMAICEAQGGFTEPPAAPLRHEFVAAAVGKVSGIDNRELARVAKLAGAPSAKAAGVEIHVKLGDAVDKGQPLFAIHAEARGELDYALAYATANPDMVDLRAR